MGRSLWWVGNGGNWSDDDNHWATESNGTPADGNLPTSSDDVYFDANSFSAADQAVSLTTSGVEKYCKDMDWTGATNTPTLSLEYSGWTDSLEITGSLTMIDNMEVVTTQTWSGIQIAGDNTVTIDTKGYEFDKVVFYIGYWDTAGTYTLASDFYTNNSIYLRPGTFNTANYKITTPLLDLESSTLNAGTSTFSFEDLSGWGYVYFGYYYDDAIINTSNATFNFEAEANIYCEHVNATLGTVNLNSEDSEVTLDLYSNDVTISNLYLALGTDLEISAQNGEELILGDLDATGTSGHNITMWGEQSGATFYPYILSKASGNVVCDYLDLKGSVATGGAHWWAGDNSTDSGNNRGWIFTDRKYPLPPFSS